MFACGLESLGFVLVFYVARAIGMIDTVELWLMNSSIIGALVNGVEEVLYVLQSKIVH